MPPPGLKKTLTTQVAAGCLKLALEGQPLKKHESCVTTYLVILRLRGHFIAKISASRRPRGRLRTATEPKGGTTGGRRLSWKGRIGGNSHGIGFRPSDDE